MNLLDILSKNVTLYPYQTALIDKKYNFSFEELWQRSGQGVNFFTQKGLIKGDVILVILPISVNLYVNLISLWRAGMVVMFIDPSRGLSHIVQCCKIQCPKAIVAPKWILFLINFISILKTVSIKILDTELLDNHYEMLESDYITECPPYHPALITFTSGSTGKPKAVVRSHGFLTKQQQILQKNLNFKPKEKDLVTMPIVALANLAVGSTSVIPNTSIRHPAKVDVKVLIEQMDFERIDRIIASPALIEKVLAYCEKSNKKIKLPRIYLGGAPVFPQLLKRLKRIFSDSQIYSVYGSTEAEPIAVIEYSQMSIEDFEGMEQGQGLLVGKPIKDIVLAILPNRWQQLIQYDYYQHFLLDHLGAYQAGEIVVHGEHVLTGYLHGYGDKENKFCIEGEQVWHRTGDTGFLDEKGRLWLLGRAEAWVQDNKSTLYPFAVECAAMAFSEVKKAALLGYNNKRYLFIEIQTLNQKKLTKALYKHLEWAVLDTIKVVKKLPVDKRHNAKIDYNALYKMI